MLLLCPSYSGPSVSGDLKPGADVKITGHVGKEMLMPNDPNATIIMVSSGSVSPTIFCFGNQLFLSDETYISVTMRT